jgi:hypothetical protein
MLAYLWQLAIALYSLGDSTFLSPVFTFSNTMYFYLQCLHFLIQCTSSVSNRATLVFMYSFTFIPTAHALIT